MMADMPNVMSCLPRRYNPANAREAIARAKAEKGKMLFGTVGTVVGVSVVFWSVGTAVAACARPAWLLRPPDTTAHAASDKP